MPNKESLSAKSGYSRMYSPIVIKETNTLSSLSDSPNSGTKPNFFIPPSHSSIWSSKLKADASFHMNLEQQTRSKQTVEEENQKVSKEVILMKIFELVIVALILIARYEFSRNFNILDSVNSFYFSAIFLMVFSIFIFGILRKYIGTRILICDMVFSLYIFTTQLLITLPCSIFVEVLAMVLSILLCIDMMVQLARMDTSERSKNYSVIV